MIRTYKELDVYNEGYELSLQIYKITSRYPKYEIYGLTSQIRRAAVSVVLNIAEGYGRKSKEEFKRFLKISLGSLYETKTLLELSKDLNYIDNEIYINLEKQYDILARRLYTLIKKYRQKTKLLRLLFGIVLL